MSRLQHKLLQQYSDHFKNVNATVSPEVTARYCADADLMYGPYLAPLAPGSHVLDLGCGTGRLLAWLAKRPNLTPVGVDACREQVEAARMGNPGVEIACREGLSYLRGNRERFAGVFCMDVLEHVPGDDLCLEWVEAIRDALAPGGFLFCRMPNAASLIGVYGRYIDLTHHRVVTSASMLQLLSAGGFVDCRIAPVRSQRLSARARLIVERVLHRAVYLICGNAIERVFTSNVCGVGFKGRSAASAEIEGSG